MNRSTRSGQPFSTGDHAGGGCAAAGVVLRLTQPLMETVAKSSADSGLGTRPETFSATTSALGLCEIGTAGRKSMITRLASWYSSVRFAASGSASAVARASKTSGETNPPNSSLAWPPPASAKNVPMKL